MPNTAPLGVSVTVLMTVDSTAKIGLFSGGTKVAEQAVGNNTPSIPLTVATLRFGATEPNGYNPGTFLIEQVSGWIAPLPENEALLVSSDLNYVPPVAEAPKPVVSIPASLSVMEGETLQIPVTKEGVGACTVQVRTIGVTAFTPTDYTGFQQLVTFGANDTVINVPLVTASDATAEGDETLKIELSLAGSTDCTLGNANGVITIMEPPRISVPTTASVKEGEVLSLIITKTGSGACSVTWRTLSGTATVAASDYLGTSATTLNFGATETSKTVTITTLADTLVEGNETFNVLLENPSGCSITAGTCVVTILDEDSAETPVGTAYTPATGFASAADCGLGQPVYKVTNLNDSGTGSLRAGAVAGNCMIVFEVAGRIELTSRLSIGANCTIAGETAPAPGITLQKGSSTELLHIVKSNIRISHITFERGYFTGISLANADVAKIAPDQGTPLATKPIVENIHFSHCAFYWGLDETIEHWPSDYFILRNISYHDCIFAEPLNKPADYDATLKNHEKPPHNYGMLIGFNTKNIDVQYCLFADMDMREPFCDATTDIVLANNIANNCTKGATIQQNGPWSGCPDPDTYRITCKGYLCISGPNTGTTWYAGFYFNSYQNPQPANSKVYVTGLYGMKGGPSNSTYQTPGEEVKYKLADGAYWESGTAKTKVNVLVNTAPIDTPGGTTALGKQELYDRALVNIGPRPKEIRKLMAGTMSIGNKNVRRTIQYLKDKTGKWPNHQNESHIGGYYAPTKVDRTLNATAKFDDGTLIGEIPTQPQPATATSKASMKAWLRKHLDQIQND